MRKVILISVLILVSATGHAEDMQKYLSETEALADEGDYQEALDRFLWFHDHALEHNPAMYGVRLSFALSSWKELGDVYPPALAAMKKTRDNKTERILEGKGTFPLFHDVAALNKTLGENDRTVELFRKLDQEQQEFARHCWNIAKEDVIKAKDYDLAHKYIDSPVREWGKIKQRYEMHTAMYGSENFGEQFKAFNENNFVEETLLLIDLALALDDEKSAGEIQTKALAVLDDPRLKDAIPEKKDETESDGGQDK